MEGLQYHSSVPEAQQSLYKQNNVVDFLIDADGRQLVKNSVRVEGTLTVYETGTTRSANGGIYFDNKLGAHAFVESCAVTTQEQGVIENVANYARLVGMVGTAQKSENDYLNSGEICELKSPHIIFSEQICGGITTRNDTDPITDDFDFSFKPECALNRMSGDDLPFRKTGTIRLSLNLARNIAALYGPKVVAGSSYQISDLTVCYYSVPDTGQGTKTQMQTVVNIKSNIQSQLANISAKVPAIANACSISFQRQSCENQLQESNYENHNLVGVNEVTFMFNDSQNQYVTFALESRQEMLNNYLSSLQSAGHNQANANKYKSNRGFGLGLSFGGYVDLRNQKFNVQLSSGASNQNVYNVYLYFHALATI